MENAQVTNAMTQNIGKLTLSLNKLNFKANASCVNFLSAKLKSSSLEESVFFEVMAQLKCQNESEVIPGK